MQTLAKVQMIRKKLSSRIFRDGSITMTPIVFIDMPMETEESPDDRTAQRGTKRKLGKVKQFISLRIVMLVTYFSLR